MPVENSVENFEISDEVLNEATEAYSSDSPTVVYIINDSSDQRTSLEEDEAKQVTSAPAEMVLQSVSVSTEKITANDATGFKASLLSVIGDYETVVTDYTYSNGSYMSHSIDVTPDYSWLIASLYVLVGIYCVFRMLSSLFNK